jgi:hypothetical protein
MSTNINKFLFSIEFNLSKIAIKINRRGPVFLVLFVVVYLLTTGYRAERKLFWYDEIFTLYISRLPDFQSVMDALKNGVDYNPPLFYEWVRLAEIFFGDDALGVRMPSIIGVGLLCLCLYRFVSIRTTVMGGMVACLFPLVTGVLFYAYEARPHGIVIGLAGLALVCWQSAVDPLQTKRRLWWLSGMTVTLMCATLTHGYALVIFAPLALGELVRNITNKQIDYTVWIALAIASTSIVAPFWLMHIVKQTIPATFWPPRFMMIAKSYMLNLGYGKFIILIPFALYLSKGLFVGKLRAGEISLSGLRKYELAACLGFIAVPFVVYLLSKVTGAPQLARYSLTCVIGFSGLIGVLASRNSILGLGLTVLLTTLIGKDFLTFKYDDHIIEPSSWRDVSTDKLIYANHFKIMEDASDRFLPIAIFGKWDFSPEFYYAPPKLSERLIVLYWDKPDFVQDGYIKLQSFCHAPGQVTEANSFVKTHKNFLAVVDSFSEIKNIERFAELGAVITLQQANEETALFDVKFP